MTTVDESTRLGELYGLDLLDKGPDERFDLITRLARRVFDAPVALVSLVDAERQWFCSNQGLSISHVARRDSICAETIFLPGPAVVIEDLSTDERFAKKRLVTGGEGLRFYAAATIRSPNGHPIGTLCVMDHEPRRFSNADLRTLQDMAELVQREIDRLARELTDPLTGRPNRAAFLIAAEYLVPLAQRRSEPLSMICVDVHGLTNVNHDFGFREGDAVLRRAADLIARSVRASDVVARLGGPEFGLLLYSTDEVNAQTVVTKIERAIADENLLRESIVALSMSFGIARADKDESVADVLGRADLAMHKARRRQLLY